MKLDIVTIFPEYFAPLDVSLLGKARQRGDVEVHVHDLRGWAHDRHRTVDDTPYGGGPGMVMKPEPWGEALDAIVPPGSSARLVVPTPSGRPFTQEMAVAYAAEPWLVFACGRYEGIDARVIEDARSRMPVDEVSIGDYVLAGGESAVLVIVEAVTRLLPGVLGNADSVSDDSFAPGRMESLLEGPVYTKPPDWRGRPVPPVLMSGNHGAIARWRRDEALRRTASNRPELIARNALDDADRRTLSEAGFPIDGEPMAH
jgi:tRNA (guanine37-N1)-methyltransferase